MRSNSQQQPTSPHNQQAQPQAQQQGQQAQQPQPQHPGMHKQLPPPTMQQGQAPMQPPAVPLQQQVAQQQLTHLFPRPGDAAAVPQLPLDAAGRMVPPLQVCDQARQTMQIHRRQHLDISAGQGTAACCMPWTRAILDILSSIRTL